MYRKINEIFVNSKMAPALIQFIHKGTRKGFSCVRCLFTGGFTRYARSTTGNTKEPLRVVALVFPSFPMCCECGFSILTHNSDLCALNHLRCLKIIKISAPLVALRAAKSASLRAAKKYSLRDPKIPAARVH